MPAKRSLQPNTVFDKQALVDFFKEHEIKDIHLNKIWRLMMRNPTTAFDSIPNLPKSAAKLLSNHFVSTTSKVKEISHSQDNRTTKLLIELQDGNMIESVVIRHSDTRSGGHTVLCVSSQVGCKMGCTFCATGTMGLMSNLTNGEILEQIVHARYHVDQGIRNIVFMGMGEPLDNWEEVKASIHGMHDRSRFNIAWHHITISTVGVISRMQQLTDEFPKLNLALSLHAPSQEIRLKIVPTSRAYTITKLLQAIKYHIIRTRNKIFIEYITIGNINASQECAHLLAKLFINLKNQVLAEMNENHANNSNVASDGSVTTNDSNNSNISNNLNNNGNESDQLDVTKHVIINLIPYNPTEVGSSYAFEAPTREQMENFKSVIMEHGLFCTIRNSTTSGQDIDGACGQLALKGAKMASDGCSSGGGSGGDGKKSDANDIEDIMGVGGKSSSVRTDWKRMNKMASQVEEGSNEKSEKSEDEKRKKRLGGMLDNSVAQISVSFAIMVVVMTVVLKLFGLDWSVVMSL